METDKIKRLDKLFTAAFGPNDKAMQDWESIKSELYNLRKLKQNISTILVGKYRIGGEISHG